MGRRSSQAQRTGSGHFGARSKKEGRGEMLGVAARAGRQGVSDRRVPSLALHTYHASRHLLRFEEDEIERQVAALREKLSSMLPPPTDVKSLKPSDTHGIAAAKKAELSKMAMALGTRSDYVEGDSFNQERQELERMKRMAEREERDRKREEDRKRYAEQREKWEQERKEKKRLRRREEDRRRKEMERDGGRSRDLDDGRRRMPPPPPPPYVRDRPRDSGYSRRSRSPPPRRGRDLDDIPPRRRSPPRDDDDEPPRRRRPSTRSPSPPPPSPY